MSSFWFPSQDPVLLERVWTLPSASESGVGRRAPTVPARREWGLGSPCSQAPKPWGGFPGSPAPHRRLRADPDRNVSGSGNRVGGRGRRRGESRPRRRGRRGCGRRREGSRERRRTEGEGRVRARAQPASLSAARGDLAGLPARGNASTSLASRPGRGAVRGGGGMEAVPA